MKTKHRSRPEIVARKDFSDLIYMLEIRHPVIAMAAKPGHFVIVKANEHSQAIALPIADFNRAKGTVTLVVQAAGKTTREMQQDCRAGSRLFGMVGPMGRPSHTSDAKKIACVGGGLGVAPASLHARAFKEAGAYVIGIVGFRSKDLIFWEDRLRACCDEVIVCTDDGSAGVKGLVTKGVRAAIKMHPDIGEVIAIGSPRMMKACAEATRKHKIKTVVSISPVVVDDIGMCGVCRVKVGDRMKSSCVDGPGFDGHRVDFDDLILRLRRYAGKEKAIESRPKICPMKERINRSPAQAARLGVDADWLVHFDDPFDEVKGG